MSEKENKNSENEIHSIPPITDADEPATQPVRFAPKEAVIEASRRKYGRPRAEVEQFINKQMEAMGWLKPTVKPQDRKQHNRSVIEDKLKQRLIDEGIEAETAEWLLDNFDVKQIQQQLDWLPYRNARNPTALLIAAIENDYGKPRSLLNPNIGQQAEHQNNN